MTEPTVEERPIGAHHLTDEAIADTIAWLERVESGEVDPANVDWLTTCGVLALQMSHLRK
jgi:hypothetical protein